MQHELVPFTKGVKASHLTNNRCVIILLTLVNLKGVLPPMKLFIPGLLQFNRQPFLCVAQNTFCCFGLLQLIIQRYERLNDI